MLASSLAKVVLERVRNGAWAPFVLSGAGPLRMSFWWMEVDGGIGTSAMSVSESSGKASVWDVPLTADTIGACIGGG